MSIETRKTGKDAEYGGPPAEDAGAFRKMTQRSPSTSHQQTEADRSELLEQLGSSLAPNGFYRSAAIWASSAASTAQLSLEYAENRRRADPDCAVFWVAGDTAESLIFSYKLHAQHLGIEDGLEGSRLLASVRDRIEAEPNWLVVLSHVVDLSLFTIGGPSTMNTSLLAYVPKSSTGAVLWTTNDRRIFATSTADALSIKTILSASPILDPIVQLEANQLRHPPLQRSTTVNVDVTAREDRKDATETPASRLSQDVSRTQRQNTSRKLLPRASTYNFNLTASAEKYQRFMGSALVSIQRVSDAKSTQTNEHGITVDLSGFDVENIPEAFADIMKQKIERLALGRNHLTSLPPWFAECTTLRYLNLRGNDFAQFPMPVCEMTSLEILDLSRNKLSSLPPEISNLVYLKVLAVSRNQISELPLTIAHMHSLLVLKIENNPITFPPEDVWQPQEAHQAGEPDIQDETAVATRIKRYLQLYISDQTATQDPKLRPLLPAQVATMDMHPSSPQLPHEHLSKFSYPLNPQPIDATDGNNGGPSQPEAVDGSSLLYWVATLQKTTQPIPRDPSSKYKSANTLTCAVWHVEDLAKLPGHLLPMEAHSTFRRTMAAHSKFRGPAMARKLLNGDLRALPEELRDNIMAVKEDLDHSLSDHHFVHTLIHLEYVWKNMPISVRAFRSSHKSSKKALTNPPRSTPDRLRAYFIREQKPLDDDPLRTSSTPTAVETGQNMAMGMPQPSPIEGPALQAGGQPSSGRRIEEIDEMFSMEPELEALALLETGNDGDHNIGETAVRRSPSVELETMPQGPKFPGLDSIGTTKVATTKNPAVENDNIGGALPRRLNKFKNLQKVGDETGVLDNPEGANTDSNAGESQLMASEPYDPDISLLRTFCHRLLEDLADVPMEFLTSFMDTPELDDILNEFLWRLHEESETLLEREVCVMINKKREFVIIFWRSQLSYTSRNWDVEASEREPRVDTPTMTMDWVKEVGEPLQEDKSSDTLLHPEKAQNPRGQAEERFVLSSSAYRWLVPKIRQCSRLSCKGFSAKSAISSEIRNRLQEDPQLREMNLDQPPIGVSIIFNLEWDPAEVLRDHGIPTSQPRIMEKILCFTGTLLNAQAVTITEYMEQTWPNRWQHLALVISRLMFSPKGAEYCYEIPHSSKMKGHERKRKEKGKHKMTTEDFEYDANNKSDKSSGLRAKIRARMTGQSSCSVTVSGGSQMVCEMAEQLAWLSATLRSRPDSLSDQGIVSCTPFVKNIRRPSEELFWVCDIALDMKHVPLIDGCDGSCWANLFWNPVLVEGYPIRARAEADTGLEIALSAIAVLMRSSQLVLWNRKLLMKGFDALVVATQITAGMVLWHLLTSKERETRISYIEPELDQVALELPEEYSLHSLEGCRHVIGWCDKATDLCGQPGLNLNIGASGLPRPPASIVIDRLYLEGGSNIIGGLNMTFNRKEKPFWLEREKDYPSLLKWISLQPVIFFDISSERAWLVDGASALLHLVRASLHADEQDPESTYDWVFDAKSLKDTWDCPPGRLSALKTLKSWDNLGLNLYVTSKRVKGGQTVTEYSTLETRVKSILHSIEILIDRQVQVASQDGITIPQTMDMHKTIAGFDIFDVISPLGPVHPRIKQLDFRMSSWQELVPAVGITTIFGRDFGELIRADEPQTVCRRWATVPEGSDLLAASVSTLKLLRERRLMRMWPGLAVGELTAKIMWLSSPSSNKACGCVSRSPAESRGADCASNPAHYIVSKKSWTARLRSRTMTPVDFSTISPEGAVIFGHIPLPGMSREEGNARSGRVQEQDGQSMDGTELSSLQGSSTELSSSLSGSLAGSSPVTQATSLASSSAGLAGAADAENGSPKAASGDGAERNGRRVSVFKRLRDVFLGGGLG